jgi:ATP-binding cassette subfamily B protein
VFDLKTTLGLTDDGHRAFKRAVLAVAVANLCAMLPFMIVIGAIVTVLDPLLTGQPLRVAHLWALAAFGLAAAALHYVAYRNEYRRTYTTAYSESEKIRIEVAEKLRRLPLSFFNRKDLSELTTNIMADCTQIEHTMSHVAPGLFADVAVVVLTCAALAFFDWRMALAVFAALPVALGLIVLSRRLQNRLSQRHVQTKLDLSRQVQEYLEGIKVVKAFGLGGERSAALEGAVRRMMNSSMRFEAGTGAWVVLGLTVLQVGLGLVVLVGVNLLTSGAIDAVKFLVFLVVSSRVYSPLIIVLTLLPEFFHLLVSGRRMQQVRREPELSGADVFKPARFDVELDDVTFAYADDPVLRHVSLSLPQGAVTALVGPSGSGKSTVTRLIARFWDVGAGALRVGGTPVTAVDPEALMAHMSFVFQDVVLFNDTVLANIRIGREGAADEDVRRAARLARCDEFIGRLPDGYDTLLGENGCTLSGGERQRISIARALLKDSPIVLLDEATASLDPENEAHIQAAITELVRGRTVIVIAHRLRTVLGADHIAVLDEGRLVEFGAADDLLAADGLFARLYRTQQASLGWTVRKEPRERLQEGQVEDAVGR